MAGSGSMFSNRVTELLGVDIPIVQAPMGYIARCAARLGGVRGRCARHHRDVLGPARPDPGRDRRDARAHRPALRRQRGPGLRPRRRHRRVRDRAGRALRDDLGGEPHPLHRPPEGGRHHRVPRRAHPARRPQGGRGGGGRAGRRGGRGRRLQEPPGRGVDGPAPPGDLPGRRARHRRGRLRRRALDGGGAWRSAPRASRWAPGWCRPRSRRSTRTGSRPSSTPTPPTPCCSTSTPSPALRVLRTARSESYELDTEPRREGGHGPVPRPLLRRRHGGRPGLRGPGGGSHRPGPARSPRSSRRRPGSAWRSSPTWPSGTSPLRTRRRRSPPRTAGGAPRPGRRTRDG